jgi:hypoxanthine phosphoribosyltransferase
MAKLPPCTFVSWRNVERLSRALARAILASGFRPDIVVAIGRGGYVPARLVCDCLHLERMTGIKVEHYSATRKQRDVVIRYPLNADLTGLNVLVVDDVNDSGDTLEAVAAYLEGFSPRALKIAVLHEKAVTRFPRRLRGQAPQGLALVRLPLGGGGGRHIFPECPATPAHRSLRKPAGGCGRSIASGWGRG